MTRRKLFALFASLPLVGRLVPKPEGLRWSTTQEMLEDDRYGVLEGLAHERRVVALLDAALEKAAARHLDQIS